MVLEVCPIDKQYFHQIAELYKIIKFKYSGDIAKVFEFMLKGSEKTIGIKISYDNYDDIVKQYYTLKLQKQIKASDIVLLDALMDDINNHYPRVGRASLERKHQETIKAFNLRRSSTSESSETPSEHIDVAYIDESLTDISQQQLQDIKESIDSVTWIEIKNFSENNPNTIQGEELEKIKNIPFMKETLDGGIKKFTLNGKVFTSMSGDRYKFSDFKYKHLNKNPDDFTKGRSLDEFNKNPKYKELLIESGAQPFEDINELCTFHCSLLQDIADELKIDVIIDADYLDNSSNDDIINNLMTYLRTLTGENIVIPYKIDPDTNLVSSLDCSDNSRGVYRDYVNKYNDYVRLSFFSKVGASRST